LINALDPDSDGDGLKDGTELGVTAGELHEDTRRGRGLFVADQDPESRTDPLVADSDGGGALDGEEDLNLNGRLDPGERDPTLAMDDLLRDSDADGVPEELDNCPEVTNPAQTDADEDGLGDSCDPDVDGDGLIDYVEITGGGCEQAAARPELPLVFLVLGALCGLRRRAHPDRRGAGKRSTLHPSRALTLGLMTLVLSAPSRLSSAQSVNEQSSLDLARWSPALTLGGVLGVDSAAQPEGSFGLNMSGLWVDDPLVVSDARTGRRLGALVAERAEAKLQGWWRPRRDALMLGVELPLTLYQSRSQRAIGTTDPLQPLISQGLGDARFLARYQLLSSAESALDIAAQLAVLAPTSLGDDYLGEPGVTLWPELLMSKAHGELRWSLNLGLRTRSGAQSLKLSTQNELNARLGGAWRVGPFELMGGLSAAVAAAEPLEGGSLRYVELLEGLGLWLSSITRLELLFGQGLSGGYGAPDWRAGLSLSYEGGRLPPDSDQDLVPDARDLCPEQREDRDGFEDQDGCPDLDNDQDWISDAQDQCPDEPEDLDDFQDEDGCPDLDNDGDLHPDLDDKCPMEAEDMDGVEDGDGCPERAGDLDGDLVMDREDECPERAGAPERAGCPEEALVRIKGDELSLEEPVLFGERSPSLSPLAFSTLKEVALILKRREQLSARLTIYLGRSGGKRARQRLAEARGRSVLDTLVREGIAPERLSLELLNPRSRQARAEGRRFAELRIQLLQPLPKIELIFPGERQRP